ncbi:hypothetical protein BH11MYX4_BH11MYX4_01790 [soil metagenome]
MAGKMKATTREELLALAVATRSRLEQIISALETEGVNRALGKHASAVHAMHKAAYPKILPWVDFVDAIQFVADNSKATMSAMAAYVIDDCAESSPDLAKLDPALVAAAITAWRRKHHQWQKVHDALVVAIPNFTPSATSMMQQWPKHARKA